MDKETWKQKYDEQPLAVQDYLLSSQSSLNAGRAQAQLAYDNDAWDRVMDVVWDTVFAKLSKEDCRERLRRLAGDRKPEDVEKAVLFHVILPLADLISWNAEGRLQELVVPLADIQSAFRVSLRPASYGAATRRIAALAKIHLLSEEMVRRLREVLISSIKGVRTIEQVKETVQRRQGDGGLGFSREQAEAFGKAMTDFLASTQVMPEQEYAEWLNKIEQEGNTKKEIRDTIETSANPEEAEIAGHVANKLMAPAHVTFSQDEAIDAAVGQIGLSGLDEYMTKRLRNLISTRLRDVRNAMDTKAVLSRAPQVGGMGLSSEEADRIAPVIEKFYQENHQKIEAEERGQIEATAIEQQKKIEERKKRESEEHAKWFQEKVQGINPLAAAHDQVVAAMKAGTGGKDQTLDISHKSLGGTTIDGVQPPPVRLTGLTEEIGGMGVAEFRRLAKTPETAVEKIKQKFETLKQESFEHWTEGIEAWHRSPMQQQYLKLVSESFATGKPVAALVAERRAQDPSFISPEEIAALVQLNSQIHF
ncbi:MAG: hypothetical protein Q8R07_02390 [Candidatus Uhrbacteria bacterium]|nr:hypothetical protein [Candidatus Uhrbacteria bacterium]